MPDLNFNYPFEDFQADIKGVEDAVVNKPFGAIPNLKIETESGEIEEFAFNTQSSIFQTSQYFSNKYGEKEGVKRSLKFDSVWHFVFGNMNLLVQNKLAILKNGKPVFRDDFDEFLAFLLQQRVSPKDGTIEKKAIKNFFLFKQRN